jgi:nucleoid-associated protein YgaU
MGELISDNDPTKLQAYATQIQGQYPMAASLLSSKASTILGLQQQRPSPGPQPIPVVGPTFPSGPTMGMDSGMPPETVQLVLNELANEADPTKLQAFADQLAPKYPIAAGLLRSRANVILVTRPPSQVVPPYPSDPANSYVVQQGDFPWKIATKFTGHGARWPELVAANPTKPRASDGNFATLLPGEKLSLPAAWSGAPPATPSAPPTTVATTDLSVVPIIAPQPSPSPGDGVALDPNMPPDVATAVRNALQTATDANQVRGFASSLAPNYPRSADLLNAKANALTAFGPTKAVVLSSAPLAPSNGPAATYKVKPGDSPSKIAATLVHDGNRWKELVAANPQKKRAPNGNFATLVPGEVLQLPSSWANGVPARPTAQGGA